MNYQDAIRIAQDAFFMLKPHCDQIKIAGSVRRQKPMVKDIEIVCIPKKGSAAPAPDLFGDGVPAPAAESVSPDFIRVVNQWKKVKGEPTGKYTQRILPGGIKLDLFMATPVNFGYILMLRTGSSEWNQRVMLPRLKGNGYRMNEGHIIWKGKPLPVEDEMAVFARMGMNFVEPKDRI